MEKGLRRRVIEALSMIVAEKPSRLDQLDIALWLDVSMGYAQMVIEVLRRYGVVDEVGKVNVEAARTMLERLQRIEGMQAELRRGRKPETAPKK